MSHSFPPGPAASRTSFTATPVRHGALQRKCACGGEIGLTGECEECRKRRLLQRSAAGVQAPGAAPAVVGAALLARGEPLEGGTRHFMESRFGHSFSDVRVHHDALAASSAGAVQAEAYTVGRDVVFASGRYEPETARGRRLIAHELAHVVQQRRGESSAGSGPVVVAPSGSAAEAEADRAEGLAAAGHVAGRPSGSAPLGLQRQESGEEEKKKEVPPSEQPRLQLHLDPTLQAQAASLQLRGFLDPSLVRLSLDQLDMESVLGAPRPPWLTLPPVSEPAASVPRGEGPAAPQPAGMGDLMRGVLKVPAVDRALTGLQDQATSRLRTDWSSLSTGEKALVLTQSAVIGGGALTGVLSSPEARQFTLDVLQNRPLPTGIPGLNFQFNLTGPDQRVLFNLNVGQLLPKRWGFR